MEPVDLACVFPIAHCNETYDTEAFYQQSTNQNQKISEILLPQSVFYPSYLKLPILSLADQSKSPKRDIRELLQNSAVLEELYYYINTAVPFATAAIGCLAMELRSRLQYFQESNS